MKSDESRLNLHGVNIVAVVESADEKSLIWAFINLWQTRGCPFQKAIRDQRSSACLANWIIA
jgi:hypothetical protein